MPGESTFTQKLDKISERIPLWLLIFILSAINFISFDTWPNEDNNFTMARHFLDPSWLEGSFSLQQWPGTNFLYWSIAGVSLKFLSFGQVAFWGRLLNYLLYTFPLSKIFEKLKVSKALSLLVLQLFFLKQEYLAGEWIWKGFEGKTMAYLFIFWAIYFVLKSQLRRAAIFSGIATYCHVLVGGWFFVGIGLFLIIDRRNFKEILNTSLTYLLIAGPFVGYLAYFILTGESIESTPSTDWIYVFFRNKHHLVPTLKEYFWQHEWPFIVLMVISLFLPFVIRKLDDRLQKVAKLTAAFNVILFIGIATTYLDTEGILLKFYLLRMSSISLLLQLLFLAGFWSQNFAIQQKLAVVTTIFSLITFLLLVPVGVKKNLNRWRESPLETAYLSFTHFVRDNTDRDDKFCFIHFNDKQENVSFINDCDRDRLVSYKMVPEGDIAILDWYKRIKQRDSVAADPGIFRTLSDQYDLQYLVSKTKLKTKGELSLIYENEFYFLYQLNH